MDRTHAPAPFKTLAALEAHLESSIDTVIEGDGLFELEHGLQCAAELARIAPDDEELQIAGLVHDIAHTICHVRDHDRVGAAVVRAVLGARVAALVGLHIAAKRYLMATDPAYGQALSQVSTQTLALQGGAMTPAEAAAFAAAPHARDAVMLRRADEAAKVPGRAVPGLDAWRPILRRVAASACGPL